MPNREEMGHACGGEQGEEQPLPLHDEAIERRIQKVRIGLVVGSGNHALRGLTQGFGAPREADLAEIDQDRSCEKGRQQQARQDAAKRQTSQPNAPLACERQEYEEHCHGIYHGEGERCAKG